MLERDIFFHQHPDAMWVCDAGALEFLEVNDAALAEYGYSREEFLELKITALWPPEDVDDFLKGLAANGPGYCKDRIFRSRRKSGEILHVQLKSQCVNWGGRDAQLIAAHDVTDRVKLEAEREALLRREEGLRQSAEQLVAQMAEQVATLRAAQRLIGMGVWKYESWSGNLTWSPEIFRIYGLDAAQVTPSFAAFGDLVHAADRERVVSNYLTFIESDRADFDFIHRIILPDGQLRHVRNIGEVSHTPEGKILVGIVQDVTQEVEQRNPSIFSICPSAV